MLWLIGVGLHDGLDMSLKARETARAVHDEGGRVFAEFYTASLSPPTLEEVLGVPVTVLGREEVERGDYLAANPAALMVVGDPFAATTHIDAAMRARELGREVGVIHGASILSAAPGLVGLQHYKFGRTTTLVKPEGWSPTSPFDGIAKNHAAGLHTLVLLDIHADKDYCMTANEGLANLLDLAKRTKSTWFNEDTSVGVVARAGGDAFVKTGAVRRAMRMDFGPPLHCIIVPGEMHAVEQEAWAALT